jgi:hypothetical protein
MGYEDNLGTGPTNITVIAGVVSGMIFGAIHCLGWNYLFQAHKEQILWRVASVGIACSPPMLVIVPFIQSFGFAVLDRFASWLLVVITCDYIFSRLTIFVLMFLSLRSLPPGAYDTVAWTKFIPHVNL